MRKHLDLINPIKTYTVRQLSVIVELSADFLIYGYSRRGLIINRKEPRHLSEILGKDYIDFIEEKQPHQKVASYGNYECCFCNKVDFIKEGSSCKKCSDLPNEEFNTKCRELSKRQSST